MKVLCIDGVNLGDKAVNFGAANSRDVIFEGESYTVINEQMCCGWLAYRLLEREILYRAARFIPLSTINEMDIVNERESTYA